MTPAQAKSEHPVLQRVPDILFDVPEIESGGNRWGTLVDIVGAGDEWRLTYDVVGGPGATFVVGLRKGAGWETSPVERWQQDFHAFFSRKSRERESELSGEVG